MKKIKNVVLLVMLFSLCFLQGCAADSSASFKLSDSQKSADIAELESLGFYEPKYFGNEYQQSQGLEVFYVKAEQGAGSSFCVFKNYRGEWCFDPYVEYYLPKLPMVITGIEPSMYERIWLLGGQDFAGAVAVQVVNPSTFSDNCDWIEIDGHRCIVAYFKPSTQGPDYGSWEMHSPALPGYSMTCGMLTSEVSREKLKQLAAEFYSKGTLEGVDASDDFIGGYGAGSWILSDYI